MTDISDGDTDIHGAVGRHLPFLRRFARALTGSQESGDAYTAATLEAIIADQSVFDTELPAKVALFRAFHAVWSSAGGADETANADVVGMEAATQKRLADLAPPSREAFLLGSLEDFSIGEVATIMDIATAETRLLQDAATADIEKQTAARILIIEDEPIIAMDLESIVLELGHASVGIADTRAIAVKMAIEERPDLILSDIQLADGSSGVDAAKDILEHFQVPIIFITAFPEQLLTGQRPEPTFLITKPFKRSAVQAAVSQALFFGTAAGIKI